MTTLLGRPAKIMVDIDSTLYPSDPLFVRALAALHGVTITLEDIDQWGWWERYMSRQQFASLIREFYHAPEEILAAEPFAGSVKTLRDWQAAGHEVWIVSDRHPRTRKPTNTWLRKLGIEPTGIILKLGINKVAWAAEHVMDLVIDDKPETIVGCLEAGMSVATLIYPYNRLLVSEHPEVMAASDWRSLRRLVEATFLGRTKSPARLKSAR